MIKIYLMGTFHFNSLPDVFSKDDQTELEKITDIISSYKPNKIAFEFFSNLQNICEDGDRIFVLIGSSHLN